MTPTPAVHYADNRSRPVCGTGHKTTTLRANVTCQHCINKVDGLPRRRRAERSDKVQDAREELEAAIWQRVTPGMHETGKEASRRAVEAILSAADKYASAVATSELDAVLGRQRGAEAAGRQS